MEIANSEPLDIDAAQRLALPAGQAEDPVVYDSSPLSEEPVEELQFAQFPALVASLRTPRANSIPEGQAWLHDHQTRIPSEPSERWWHSEAIGDTATLAPPWWDVAVRRPIGASHETLKIDIANLTTNALLYSSYVQSITAAPSIQEAALLTQTAAFDWHGFLESSYDDVSDPVGSLLVTGTNDTRYKNQNVSVKGGVRRRNTAGGQVEAFQRFGRQEDNSRFLNPNPQRTTRLELRYTQPLLKGAGSTYNQSEIVLAHILLDRTSDALAQELEAHLVRVTEAYWELYRSRAEFLQRRKLLMSAQDILQNLKSRRDVDAVERQVFRAQSAVANRESEMIRAETRIRNWQSRLRLLVNDPALVQASNREFLPVEAPVLYDVPLSMSDSLHTALLNRPDISQAIRDARAATVRLGVARKDLLPQLDFVVSSYVAGLAAAADKGQAFGNQFSEGRPTFSAGLQFEVPIGNRAAAAQATQRQYELNQAMSRFSLKVEEALTTVEVAVREVQTSRGEIIAKFKSMSAVQKEADYLSDRWTLLPYANDSAAQLLENLLEAQERLADEELALVDAQVRYALALVALKSEMGTLLRMNSN
ncbi:MAG: TolC family protein [Planctomycetales bacterium]|nr:TolC family protein [Planctomycetales bacterium]